MAFARGMANRAIQRSALAVIVVPTRTAATIPTQTRPNIAPLRDGALNNIVEALRRRMEV